MLYAEKPRLLKNLGGSRPFYGFVGEFKLWLQAHSFGGLRFENLTLTPHCGRKLPILWGIESSVTFPFVETSRIVRC